MNAQNWLLLTYKVPPEPAKKRIALWRKLTGMGAVYLQNGVCLLPTTDDHTRRLKIIENQINEMAGEFRPAENGCADRAQKTKSLPASKADRDEDTKNLGKCVDFEAEIAHETEFALHPRRVGRKRCRSEEAPVLAGKNRQARLLRCHAGRRGSRTAQRLRSLAGRLRATGVRRSR
uniref:ChrB domain protein n=1 Tax=hospital metagenome TaxID=1755691 RepID=A0A4P9D7U5_9ZZZZ